MKKVTIVIPGHSIEKDAGGHWGSTELYQEIAFRVPGQDFPFERTGIHNPHLKPNTPTSYLGGSMQVVQGAITCHRILTILWGYEVNILIPAGRPGYLKNAVPATLSEATVMEAELRKTLGDEVRIECFSDNLTTEDDARVVLNGARNPDCERVLVIMMTFRIARMEVLLQQVAKKEPDLAPFLSKIAVIPAEAFCPNTEELIEMWLSKAHERTMGNERFGFAKAITGTVSTTGGKT